MVDIGVEGPEWAGAVVVHLLFGLVVGLWTGLATAVWFPLAGV